MVAEGEPIRSIEDVNSRIDHCIKAYSGLEKLLWAVLTTIFLAGLVVLFYGVWRADRVLMGLAAGGNGLCCWPTLKLIQLHRRKVALGVIPAITALLSRRDAAREIHSLVKNLLDRS
jgi:hypothetical protein